METGAGVPAEDTIEMGRTVVEAKIVLFRVHQALLTITKLRRLSYLDAQGSLEMAVVLKGLSPLGASGKRYLSYPKRTLVLLRRSHSDHDSFPHCYSQIKMEVNQRGRSE